MRIAVVGCPGSGKSTLALELHKILHLPLFHLDKYYWQPGWQRPDREEFKKIHHQLCDQDNWIIEGMATRLFDYRAAKADVIVFLDIPLYKCIYRIFKRSFFNYGKVRNTSPAGCPEKLPDIEFIKYVLSFNFKYKPVIKKELAKYKNQKNIVILKNDADIKKFLKEFGEYKI